MRLGSRVRSLEKRGMDSARCCPVRRARGWPAVMIAGAPGVPEARPENWPLGCHACGKVMAAMLIGIGASPTAQRARAFLEAI